MKAKSSENEENIHKMKSDLNFNILKYSKFLGFTYLKYSRVYDIYLAVFIWVDGIGAGALTQGKKLIKV